MVRRAGFALLTSAMHMATVTGVTGVAVHAEGLIEQRLRSFLARAVVLRPRLSDAQLPLAGWPIRLARG